MILFSSTYVVTNSQLSQLFILLSQFLVSTLPPSTPATILVAIFCEFSICRSLLEWYGPCFLPTLNGPNFLNTGELSR